MNGPDQVAQLGAFASESTARAVLAAQQASDPRLMSGLTTRVDGVVVNGKTMYRAIVAGLASPDAAEAFCTAVRSENRPCLTRAAARR